MGEVDRRILDAAAELFLELGFQRTTFEQVADAAHASKATLYGRYATKEVLFTAVVRRDADAFARRVAGTSVTGSIRQRLVSAGLELADATLTRRTISLMRVTAAEVTTFPGLAQEGFRIGYGECVRRIEAVVGQGRDAVRDPSTLATSFVEMALHPLYVHAIFGAELTMLRQRARWDVTRVADFLLSDGELGAR